MSFFNCNLTGAGAGGLLTKFEKSVTIGSVETAVIQISLKDDISNYANITNEQIIVDIANISASEAGTATLTQNYDAEQGVITITSDSSKIPFVVDSTVEVIIYVASAVQIPPPPETAVYKIGTINYEVSSTFNVGELYPELNIRSIEDSDFVFNCKQCNGGGPDANSDETASWHPRNSGTVSMSYNNDTGILSVTAGNVGTTSTQFMGDVLLIIGEVLDNS